MCEGSKTDIRFAVPLSDPKELSFLHEAGADEIYLGLLEERWTSLYGNHDSVSRRQGLANLHTREQLKEVLKRAKDADIPVDLTLNGRYTPPQYHYLEELAGWFADRGGRSVILRDIGLMLRLRQSGHGKKSLSGGEDVPMDCVYCESSSREEMAQKPQSVHPGVAKNRGNIETAGKKEGRGRLRLTASLLAVTVNADGARFFHELGADRIVLPRFLKISEMKKIAAQEPGLEYEAMIFGDQCPMIDGFCRSFHGQPHEKADPGDIESNRSDRSALGSNEPEKTTDIEYSGDEAASFSTFDTSCEAHHLCGGLCRQADPCAACRLRELAAAGILVMKFGGRGTPLEYRLRTLHFFNRTRQILQQNDPQEDVHEAYNNEITDIFKQMYRETFGHDCSCYYQ